MAAHPFHNGVTPCPVCGEPVNLSTQSVVRLPDLLGGPRPEFEGLEGVYHRSCLPLLAQFGTLVGEWEDWQRECFRRRNHSQSLFNNVIAFDTQRFLCYRYLHAFEHQLLEFPRLMDWHLNQSQLQTLYRILVGLDEDVFASEQQVFAEDFQAATDPVQDLVRVVRTWELIVPMTVTDMDFIALGNHLNLEGDLQHRPQWVDFSRIQQQLGIVDRSDDPDFIADHLQGEVIGFAPSQIHPAMMNLQIRIHPRDEVELTLWEALELRGSLLEYTEQLELDWQPDPLWRRDLPADDGEAPVSDDDLPRWE